VRFRVLAVNATGASPASANSSGTINAQ
jgi:hypothetical protein